MARPVLALRPLLTAEFILLLGFVSVAISGSARSMESPGCSPDSWTGEPAFHQKEVYEFRQQVESGPFYKELVAQLGKPLACKTTVKDGRISFSYSFRKHGHLEACITQSIEVTEQRVQLQSISQKRAIALLKEA